MTSYLCRDLLMALLRLWATFEWNLRRCKQPQIEFPAAICIKLFPLCYLWMGFTEEMDYPQIEPTKKSGYLESNTMGTQSITHALSITCFVNIAYIRHLK
jgi:hypothetical protein